MVVLAFSLSFMIAPEYCSQGVEACFHRLWHWIDACVHHVALLILLCGYALIMVAVLELLLSSDARSCWSDHYSPLLILSTPILSNPPPHVSNNDSSVDPYRVIEQHFENWTLPSSSVDEMSLTVSIRHHSVHCDLEFLAPSLENVTWYALSHPRSVRCSRRHREQLRFYCPVIERVTLVQNRSFVTTHQTAICADHSLRVKRWMHTEHGDCTIVLECIPHTSEPHPKPTPSKFAEFAISCICILLIGMAPIAPVIILVLLIIGFGLALWFAIGYAIYLWVYQTWILTSCLTQIHLPTTTFLSTPPPPVLITLTMLAPSIVVARLAFQKLKMIIN